VLIRFVSAVNEHQDELTLQNGKERVWKERLLHWSTPYHGRSISVIVL